MKRIAIAAQWFCEALRMDAPRRAIIWWGILLACATVRVVVPLAVLASAGKALPGLPGYDYGPLYGDANGYYAGAREAVSTMRRDALLLFAIGMLASALGVFGGRKGAPGWLLALIAGAGLAAMATVVVVEMKPAGTPVIGWSLLWAIPLFPMRVLDPTMGPDEAYVPALALSLAANAVIVVATACVGLWATGRRVVGLVAAAAWAFWPFVPGLIVGANSWSNGMWPIDAGLNLYTEPLSTMLVVLAVALVLRSPPTDLAMVLAGLALGYATVVKLTNGGIAVALVVALLVFGRIRAALLATVAGLLFAPIPIVFWGKGYGTYYEGGVSVNPHPFGLQYVTHAWTDSSLFTPTLTVLLAVPAIIGCVVVSTRFVRTVLALPIVVTVMTYSLYDVTPMHPRFFYVILPLVLVLDAVALVSMVGRGAQRPRTAG